MMPTAASLIAMATAALLCAWGARRDLQFPTALTLLAFVCTGGAASLLFGGAYAPVAALTVTCLLIAEADRRHHLIPDMFTLAVLIFSFALPCADESGARLDWRGGTRRDIPADPSNLHGLARHRSTWLGRRKIGGRDGRGAGAGLWICGSRHWRRGHAADGHGAFARRRDGVGRALRDRPRCGDCGDGDCSHRDAMKARFQTGFSTLEVIAAVAIIAVALVPIAALQSQLARNQARLAAMQEETSAVQNAMTLLREINPMLTPQGERRLDDRTALTWTSAPASPRAQTANPQGSTCNSTT